MCMSTSRPQLAPHRIRSDILHEFAGSYSPPIHKKRKFNSLRKMNSYKHSTRISSSEIFITKSLLKKMLLSSTLDELWQRIYEKKEINIFNSSTIHWLFHWASKDYNKYITQASSITIACLCFPNELIDGVKEQIFKPQIIRNIIKVISSNKLLISTHINKDEILINDKIGSGAGGLVYSGMYNNKSVAIKMFKYENTWIGASNEFYYEATLMSIFGSFKHFIHCFGVNIKEGFIVMPIANNGSLDKLLEQNDFIIPWNIKLRMISQIAKAVQILHQYNILHRDLKPANILLDDDYNCYLADFGTSRTPTKSRTMTMNVGTATHMAPEVIQGNGNYSEAIDVFSFSIIVWQIAADCAFPFIDNNISLRDIPNFILSGNRLKIPETAPISIQKLIKKCWDQSPKKRPSFEQICQILKNI